MTFENRRLIAFMAISILTILIPKILSKEDLRQEIVYDGSEKFTQIKSCKYQNVEKQEIIMENGKSMKIQYVKNEIIFLAEIGTKYEDIKAIVQKHGGVIVGYIAFIDSYQVEFLDCTYQELQDKIQLFKREEKIDAETVSFNYYSQVTTMDNK